MTTLAKLSPALFENRSCGRKLIAMISQFCNESQREDTSLKNRPMVTAEELDASEGNCKNETDIDELEAPTTCCMSGCTNCVWIQYAEKLSEKVMNSREDVQKIIMDKVEDPNMRAFLSMELRCRNLGKS